MSSGYAGCFGLGAEAREQVGSFSRRLTGYAHSHSATIGKVRF